MILQYYEAPGLAACSTAVADPRSAGDPAGGRGQPDAAKGIETRKLFEVCRPRDVPFIIFVNNLDPRWPLPLGPVGRDRAGSRA